MAPDPAGANWGKEAMYVVEFIVSFALVGGVAAILLNGFEGAVAENSTAHTIIAGALTELGVIFTTYFPILVVIAIVVVVLLIARRSGLLGGLGGSEPYS